MGKRPTETAKAALILHDNLAELHVELQPTPVWDGGLPPSTCQAAWHSQMLAVANHPGNGKPPQTTTNVTHTSMLCPL